MGKAGYRKFLKKERAKVKLKGTKKLLPKGQNVTDTNFKVKKVVIKDQLKEHQSGEVLSKKKLNLKELLSRLRHHNASVKLDAIEGLKELLNSNSNETMRLEATNIIEGISKLTLDLSQTVRTEARKLLTLIISQMPLKELSPLFPSLSSYLMCGLTHIEHPIREDSLYLLDSLLTLAPSLCVDQVSRLLPICLDLVSESTSGSRTLSLHLDSKFGAVKWRGKVLGRIRTLLHSVVKSLEGNLKQEIDAKNVYCKEVKWEPDKEVYAPLYSMNFHEIMNDDTFLSLKRDEVDPETEFDYKDFASLLIPLLLDAFLELAPISEEKSSFQNSDDNTISCNAAAYLICSTEIIQALCDILEKTGKEENEKWMQKKFSDLITNRLVLGRFPFSVESSHVSKKMKKNQKDCYLEVFKYDPINFSCHNLNLKLGKLIVNLVKPVHWEGLISYLKRCLRHPEKLSNEECIALASCLLSICKKIQNEETKKLVSTISKYCLNSKITSKNIFFDFLINIALNTKMTLLHDDSSFKKWLASLPELLINDTIPGQYLEAILGLCPLDFPDFTEALEGYIETILDNIPQVNVPNLEQEQVQKKLVNLLFWVKDWDEDLLNGIIRGIQNEYWGKSVTKYLCDVLLVICESSRSAPLKELLQTNDWWKQNIQ